MFPGKKQLQKLLKGEIAAGIEAELLSGGFVFNYCVVKKTKSTLEISGHGSGITGIDHLIPPIKTSVPVYLTINGKGIIHKLLAAGEDESEASLIQRVFPNASPDDFYIQRLPAAGGHVMVSAIRRTVVDELISIVAKSGYHIVALFLGPFHIVALKQQIAGNSDNMTIAGHLLQLENGLLKNYTTSSVPANENTISFGEERVSERSVIALSAAVSHFAGTFASVNAPFLESEQEEHFHSRLFVAGGWATLIAFFTILLANFFFFDHYKEKHRKSEVAVLQNKDQLMALQKLEEELRSKRRFIEQAGLVQTSRVSFYADRLATDLLSTLQFTDMFINPVEKSSDISKKEMRFVSKTISVSGISKKSSELNNWIKLLKKEKWVDDVSIINYSQEDKQEPGSFTIRLKVK